MEHIVSFDELHPRKVVRKEAGEESSGHICPAITMEESQRFKSLMEEREQIRAVEAPGTNRPPAKIQKVISLLRDDQHMRFVNYFEPSMISLSPIHHGNPKYQLGEKHKRRLAYEFVIGLNCNNGNTLENDINCLYGKIKKEIKLLRECFEEEVTKNYDDETLAWMLFVDGCAILQYMLCAAKNKFEEFYIKNDSVVFAQLDLFLLENPVPYRLLKLLMKHSGKEEQLRNSIERFIRNNNYQQTMQQRQGEIDPTHLLDLLRTSLLGSPCLRAKLSSSRRPFTYQDQDWQSYRNVQELKAVGIRLKCTKNNSYLRNISFTRLFGVYPGYLWLPPIIVDDSTGPTFMNLIAYEMCEDFKNDFGITSYISFLHSLIDDVNDVKELRKAGVLYNFLGSIQEVVDLFDKMGTAGLVPNIEAYMDVRVVIQDYYDNKLMTWMTQSFYNHFNAPWSMTTFLFTMVFALGLSAIQTWYAAHPPPGPCDNFCKKS